ncbi:MAG: 1,4-dihydroxy-6-naphthoate synthase [Desulfovermiculus sp.]|nr:1,4-dihydroxy-6-naphthoate synthase [Desulfovermiculus sp.]
MAQTLKLGISPCPNDTYIFAPLLQERIDLHPYALQYQLADVQELNEAVWAQALDVAKISMAVYPQIHEHYRLLGCGGALGRGCGPLLVAGRPRKIKELAQVPIAVPGKLTTACMLLLAHGGFQGRLQVMRYDKIMPAVAQGEVQAGVIIHEGRFTYPDHGLHLVLDLGAWWEKHTGLPIPLGGIVARRSLGSEFAAWMEDRIRASLDYAREHEAEIWPFIQEQAQELDARTIREHIRTFVNDFSRDMGDDGWAAVQAVFQRTGQKV